jgi:hypothetical protein
MLDALNGYMTAHGLPGWLQPIVVAFLCSMPVAIVLVIWEQRLTGGQGASFNPKAWQVAVVFSAFLYVRDYTETGHRILLWPDHHWLYWHEHWWQIVVGVVIAGLLAKQASKLYGAMGRRSHPQPDTGHSFQWED